MTWTDPVDLPTGYVISSPRWNWLAGSASSLMQLKAHAHGGVVGEGGQSLGPMALLDYTDAAAPAAPAAGQTRVYAVSAVPHFRPSGGADTIIAKTTDATVDAAAHHGRHDAAGADPMVVDAAAATASLRTLGLGAAQGTPGDTFAAHHARHEPGGADPMAVDAAVGTGSLRTLAELDAAAATQGVIGSRVRRQAVFWGGP